MKELIQQKYWVHERGVEMLLPPQAKPVQDSDIRESQRLSQIHNDGVLKNRYPTQQSGEAFMQTVDMNRRQTMLTMAGEAAEKIISEWRDINPDKEITVVLFGSVAKGLVKNCEQSDPSNIDMAVVGDITDDEKEALYDAIRPYRKEVQDQLLASCGNVEVGDSNPANLGVSIQHISKLTNGHYSGMVNHLKAAAFPLYDPEGMWHELEGNALEKLAIEKKEKESKKKKRTLYTNQRGQKVFSPDRESIEKSLLPPSGDIYTQPHLF